MDSRDDFVGPVNLGNPTELTVAQLANAVLELTGSRSRLEFKPLPCDDPRQRRPDIALARAELDWEPTTPLHDGLLRTIEYFDALLGADSKVSRPHVERLTRSVA